LFPSIFPWFFLSFLFSCISSLLFWQSVPNCYSIPSALLSKHLLFTIIYLQYRKIGCLFNN
jgi:hypothetical protein